jgi:UDP-N-acetylmuramoyl-L-alanyl-D-glutamate--2,6-diaminopimelate ligase
MKLSELFAALPVTLSGADVDVTGLVYDSRKVLPGTLFAAWTGQKADGHRFIAEAIRRGASAILCERPVDTGSVPRVVVKDVRAVLARTAQVFYSDPAACLTMVGVTGTSGKTTTVHLIESILRAAGRTPGIIGTLGTRYARTQTETGLTTPDAVDLVALLARMREAGVDSVAMEVSSHALAMHRVAGVSFDVGVFTNLTQDHLDFHTTLDEYFAAKKRLFTERLKPQGIAVLNFDDARVQSLAQGAAEKVLSFSLNEASAQISVRTLELSRQGIKMRAITPVGEMSLSSPLIGRFNAENILAAVGVGVALRCNLSQIACGVAELKAVPGRLELVSSEGEPQVFVDYAHKPDALEKALLTMREVTAGRLICVVGCGGDRDRTKREKMGEVAATAADWTVVTNDNPRSEEPAAIAAAIERGLTSQGLRQSREVKRGAYTVELDREKAICLAILSATPRDTVLIAGKGHETYQIVGDKTLPFDDRVVARAVLAANRAREGRRARNG